MIASGPSTDRSYGQPFIDEVRSRLPLADVVARYTMLKRSGSALRGPCPIHGSSKMSTSLSVRNNRYRCFACGVHGDVLSFTMWAERIDFPEAVRRLAREAGLDVPSTSSASPNDTAADAQRRRENEERRARHEAEEAAERTEGIAAALKLTPTSCFSVSASSTSSRVPRPPGSATKASPR